MEVQSLPIACHGKLPSDREYVHYQIGTLPVGAFDRWVRTAHAQAFLGRATDVRHAYDRAPSYHFAFASEAHALPLLGVLKTSRDATGRRYPFWVAWAEPTSPDNGLQGRVLRARERFALGTAFVDAATTGSLSRAGVAGHLEQMAASATHPDRHARHARYDAFLQTVTIGTLTQACAWAGRNDAPPNASPPHTSPPPNASPPQTSPPQTSPRHTPPDASSNGAPGTGRHLLAAWLDVLVRSRSVSGGRLRYGVRLPLCSLSTDLHDVAFWIEATARLLGGYGDPAALFWTPPPDDDAVGSLVVFRDAPPHRLYTYLLHPPAGSRDVYDVAHDASPGVEQSLPVHLRSLLDRPDLSLRAFLNHLRG